MYNLDNNNEHTKEVDIKSVENNNWNNMYNSSCIMCCNI